MKPFQSFRSHERQRWTALEYPCLLAFETTHPRFRWMEGGHGIILTVNSGYE
jgi:hypothetical protein